MAITEPIIGRPAGERFYRGVRQPPVREAELEPPLPQTPQDYNSERDILGAILADNKYLKEAQQENLCAADFFDVRHQVVYEAMLDIAARQEHIDLLPVLDELEGKKKLERGGAEAYLASLCCMPTINNNSQLWIRSIKKNSLCRSLLRLGHKMELAAYAANGKQRVAILCEAIEHLTTKLQEETAVPAETFLRMFHTIEDFDNSPGLTFAIDGFLQTGAATMIAGLSGQSKTFIQLSMVSSLLSGKKLWDFFEVKERAARLVYLIPESSIGPFKHRLELFGLMEHIRNDRLLVRTLSKGPTPLLSDPMILRAAQGSDVFLDTASRFAEGDENSAGDNQRGLASDIFAMLGSGARLVVCAHHAPKSFATQTTMTLESIARGSGDIGAMLATCWGIRQLDQDRNIVYVQNVKPRDFEACRPFQLIGRPYIDTEGNFRLHKRPGESGFLQDELGLGRDEGGAPAEQREQRLQRIEVVRKWLDETPDLTRNDVVRLFGEKGITVSYDTAKNYISSARKGRV